MYESIRVERLARIVATTSSVQICRALSRSLASSHGRRQMAGSGRVTSHVLPPSRRSSFRSRTRMCRDTSVADDRA